MHVLPLLHRLIFTFRPQYKCLQKKTRVSFVKQNAGPSCFVVLIKSLTLDTNRLGRITLVYPKY